MLIKKIVFYIALAVSLIFILLAVDNYFAFDKSCLFEYAKDITSFLPDAKEPIELPVNNYYIRLKYKGAKDGMEIPRILVNRSKILIPISRKDKNDEVIFNFEAKRNDFTDKNLSMEFVLPEGINFYEVRIRNYGRIFKDNLVILERENKPFNFAISRIFLRQLAVFILAFLVLVLFLSKILFSKSRGNILLFILTVFVMIILIEICFRFTARDRQEVSPRYMKVVDKEVGYVYRPNFKGNLIKPEFKTTITIGPSGLRDKKAFIVDTNIDNILVLGDSFAFGAGVEDNETYSYLLEQKLNQSLKGKVRVYNAGVDGYGTYQEAAYLRRIKDRIEPKMVILSFFLGNDFIDNYLWKNAPIHYIDRGGYLVKIKDGQESNSSLWKNISDNIDAFLLNKSSAYQYFRNKIIMRAPPKDIVTDYLRYNDQLFLSQNEQLESDNIKRMELASFEALAELNLYCQANKMKLLVMLIPIKEQVYPNLWQEFLKKQGIGYDMAPDEINKRLVSFLKLEDIRFLDLYDVFKEAAKTQVLYYGESHFNPKGHILAADSLYQYLIANDLDKL